MKRGEVEDAAFILSIVAVGYRVGEISASFGLHY